MKNLTGTVFFLHAISVLVMGLPSATASETDRSLARPVVDDRWVRPSPQAPAQPIWGHAQGLRVGLAPLPGPRGLLRIYAPHIGLPELRVINFIAVEPVVSGATQRGYSELERSSLDATRGKRFWSADDRRDPTPQRPDRPARGVLNREGGVDILRVIVFVEPFENGARACLRLAFRSDRPEEVGIAAYAQDNSRPMQYCIVTATMGNYARLRRLHLKDQSVLANRLWPSFQGDGFAPPHEFALRQLFRDGRGDVLVAATPDETNPRDARYAPDTPPWWKYQGAVATQYWRAEKPDPKLVARVNGRVTYWASRAPIPGGVAYENFELSAPHHDGQEFWFGVTRRTPEELRR